MRLPCWKALVLAFVFTAACHEPTAPPPTISGSFVLESIDGNSLPAIISAGAGDTTQMLSSTVEFDASGRAITVNHLRHSYLQYPAEETTLTRTQSYRIKGDSIEIGAFGACPGTVMCVGNVHGVLSGPTMAIAAWYNPYPTNPVVFVYRLVGSS